ncbi:unnamed protein product [Closterium sp. Yama58-4]|nr:unnamed protein product [Closterium sp. Yama58-4]
MLSCFFFRPPLSTRAAPFEQKIAAEQSLRREKEASALLQQMLQQEREAKAVMLAAREDEAAEIDGEKRALIARSRQLAARVERAEERLEGLEQEKEAVILDRDAIAMESEVLVERLGEVEQTVEMLRQENVNLEAELLAAQRSRDTYWTHSIALYQDKAKLEEQLAQLSSISSNLAGGRTKAAATLGKKTQTPTRAGAGGAAAAGGARRNSLPFPNPRSSASPLTSLETFTSPFALHPTALNSAPQLLKQQLTFGTVYECPPLLASASMSASTSAAIGMTQHGGLDMVRAASIASGAPSTANAAASGGAISAAGGFDSAGMRRSGSFTAYQAPASTLLTRSLSSNTAEHRARQASMAAAGGGGRGEILNGAAGLAAVHEGPE